MTGNRLHSWRLVEGQHNHARRAVGTGGISPNVVLACLLLFIAVLATVSISIQYVVYLHPDVRLRLTTARMFDLDRESNLPTWFSTIQLFVCALVLGAIAQHAWQKDRRLAFYWTGLAIVFVGLSFDETASVHETAITVTQRALGTTGALHNAWVIPAMVFVAIFVIAYMKFLLALPRRFAVLFVVSGAIFVGGSVGMEMVSWHHLYPRFVELGWEQGRDFTFAVLNHIEEVMEMSGVALFLWVLLDYARRHGVDLSLRIAEGAGAAPGRPSADNFASENPVPR